MSGGAVLIGATVAQSISNLFNAVNLGPGKGTVYGNWGGMPFNIGHDFIATGLDANNLYLRNALDGTNDYGYPANQQIGVLTSYPLTSATFVNNQALFPVYCWGNTMDGIPTELPSDVGDPRIIIGRDFSNAIPAPEIYTPLIYPHPLQLSSRGSSSTTIAPPGGLQAMPTPGS